MKSAFLLSWVFITSLSERQPLTSPGLTQVGRDRAWLWAVDPAQPLTGDTATVTLLSDLQNGCASGASQKGLVERVNMCQVLSSACWKHPINVSSDNYCLFMGSTS